MIERMKLIIQAKAHSQREFADMMGWTPQYLTNMLGCRSGLGLNPVAAIIDKFPDINPRWFITGKGSMYDTSAPSSLYQRTLSMVESLMDLSKYVAVMNDQERARLDDMINHGVPCHFSDDEIASMKSRLHDLNRERDSIIEQAMNESVCRTQKAH